MKKIVLIATLLGSLWACDSNVDPLPTSASVTFNFTHLINGEEFDLENSMMELPTGEVFTPNKFKYYISNITFTNTSNQETYTLEDGYYLIDQAGQKSFSFVIPTAAYDQLSFYVGVDQERNLSIDQVGDLDPSNDMVWNWNTGYKFLVLEGEWQYGESVREGLIIHIGNNDPASTVNFREITFDLNQAAIDLERNSEVNLDFEAELSALFDAPNEIVIHELENTSIMGGEWAIKVAENYQEGMFTLK